MLDNMMDSLIGNIFGAEGFTDAMENVEVTYTCSECGDVLIEEKGFGDEDEDPMEKMQDLAENVTDHFQNEHPYVFEEDEGDE